MIIDRDTYIDNKGRMLLVAKDESHSKNGDNRYMIIDLTNGTAEDEFNDADLGHITKEWRHHNLTIEPTRRGRPKTTIKVVDDLPQLLVIGEQITPQKLSDTFTDRFLKKHGMSPMDGLYVGYFACKETEKDTPVMIVSATDTVEYRGKSQWKFIKNAEKAVNEKQDKDVIEGAQGLTE